MNISATDFRINLTQRDKTVVLNLNGRFDFQAHRSFRESSKEALTRQDGRDVVVDLSGVIYMDSAALGMLLMLRDSAALSNHSVSLSGANDSVQRVLDIARFERLFTIKRR